MSFRVLLLLFGIGFLGCSGSKPVAFATPETTVVAPPATDEGLSALPAPGPEARAERSEHAQAKVPVFPEDPAWGDVDAPVTIVEFSDFECPFCGRVQETLNALKETYGPAELRIVWKHNPLPFHERARGAHDVAAAVQLVAGNDAFFRFHELAFRNQNDLTPENLESWANQAGVPPQSLRAALSSGKPGKKVEQDIELAKSVDVLGTPAFRINGRGLAGAQPFDEFKKVIDTELAVAKGLIAAGTPRRAVYAQLTDKNFQETPAPEAKPEEASDTTIWKVSVLPDDPVRGPKDALVTIVQFSEFQCPFCRKVDGALAELLKLYPTEVRIVWKDNPLPFHERALPAAIFARVAYKLRGNDGFWRLHDALLASQPNLGEQQFQALAKDHGLPWAPVQAALVANRAPKIEESQDVAEGLQALGTPHFFINGRRLRGAQPLEQFRTLVDEQLASAKGLVGRGVPRGNVYAKLMKTAQGPPAPERKQVPLRADAALRGSARAPVVIQLFSDFQCPFCKRVEPTLEELEKEFKGQLRVVWRHLPLPFHKQAELAAEASEEVLAQKGVKAFWQYHALLFQAQAEPRGLEQANLVALARTLGVDGARFETALNGHIHVAKVRADSGAADHAGITGTPAFLINDYYLSGAQPAAKFRKLIRLALKGKR